MRKLKLIICIILLGITSYIFCGALDKEKSNAANIRFAVGDELICAWKTETGYYLFLPSYVDVNMVYLNEGSDELEFPDLQLRLCENDSIEGLPIDQALTCKNITTNEVCSFTIMKSENLPTIYLNTKSGTMNNIHADEEYKENGSINVVDADGKNAYDRAIKYIKGRGNVTWKYYDKKPYLFELEEEISLLGLNKGAKWILISNATDSTLIRNDITYQMADVLNMKYTERGQFIDLYLNGVYAGNYYLCAKIEVGKERLNITDLEAENERLNDKENMDTYPNFVEGDLKAKQLGNNPTDISGGYLIERDFPQRFHEEYDTNPSVFTTKTGENYVVHSPKYCSKEQIRYISSFMQETEDAIYADDGYNPTTGRNFTEYINLESFVNKYLLEEVSKNYDGGVSSSFFYKDIDSVNPLLFAGPGWDYDMTFGNVADWMRDYASDPEGISRLTWHTDMTYWIEKLCKREEFDALTKQYYKMYASPYLQQLMDDKVDNTWNEIHDSAKMNYVRWNGSPDVGTLEEEIEYLKQYIKERKDFLDKMWIDNEKYCMVKYINFDEVYDIKYVKQGERLGSMPSAGNSEWILKGWYEKNSHVEASPNDIVEDDLILYSKYKILTE